MTITRRTFLSSLAAVGLAPALPGILPASTPDTFSLSDLFKEAGGMHWEVGKPIQYY